MTVPSDVNKHIYAGNGVTRVWPYSFLLYDAAHLQVWVKRGEEESVQLSSGFTLNELEKTVTYPPEGTGEAPLSADDQIIIMRVVPVLQLLDLENGGDFFAETIEEHLDLIVMMIQQITETLRRAVVGPVDQNDSGVAYQALLDAVDEAKAARDEAKQIAENLSEENKAQIEAALAEMETLIADAEEYAEEARKHAQDYIPFSFGRFRVRGNHLVVDYYGDAGKDDIKINTAGHIIVYSEGEEKIDAGRVRIAFVGDYEADALYSFLDCVKYSGSWWLHNGTEPTAGVEPEEGSVWTRFGAKGDIGPQGETGEQGPQGIQGDKGDQGETGDAATVAVGTVTTLDEGESATVTNSGDEYAAVLNFGIPKGATGEQGPKGDKGDTGEAGPAGADGAAAGFGTPTATAAQLASTAAPTVTVTASGDDTAKVFSFSFGIPKGEKGDTGETGDAATVAVGTVTTLDEGESATVTNSGDEYAAVLNFGIPKGATGEQGPKGDKGDTGEAGPAGADGAAAGFGTPTATAAQLASTAAPTVTVTASGDDTAKVFSFSFGIPKGEKGDTGETGATGPQGAAGTSVTGAKLVGNHLVIVTNG